MEAENTKPEELPLPPPYGLLLFKIEGHRTWRMNPVKNEEELTRYLSTQPNHPKITDKKWFSIDRIEGTITEQN